MPTLPPEVGALAARRWGVFTLDEVVDAGWKPEQTEQSPRRGGRARSTTSHGTGRFDAQRDKARDRHARRVGWQVDRVTDQELRESFDRAIAEWVEMFRLR